MEILDREVLLSVDAIVFQDLGEKAEKGRRTSFDL